MTCYIGVDPGKSGGIAIMDDGEVELINMPGTLEEMLEIFMTCPNHSHAVVERVGGYVPRTKGRNPDGSGQPGSMMFTFGYNVGCLHMALVAAKIPFELVTSRTWQKEFEIESRGRSETKTAFKNRIKDVALELYPKERITLKVCDALLLACYLRIKMN